MLARGRRECIVDGTTIFGGGNRATEAGVLGDVLLDRDAELAALGRRLATVRAGSGRLILVEGPAGIGKSSLLAAVADAAGAYDLTVLRARGGALEQDAAWGVARQLFAPVRTGSAWSELGVGAARLAQRALDPDAAEPVAAADAMHAAAHGLTWLASNLAERAPALLVVDDVHWADAPSLRWLAQLARRLDELSLGVLCAVRAGEPASDAELLAELLAAAPEPPVRPRALGPAAADALVRERLPAATAAFAQACHAVTGGNPFLLGALLTHLTAEGVAPTDQVAAGLSAFGPEQVARNVERQLARLPDGAAALARAFAVLGRDAPLRHAAQLAKLPPETAARLADALRAAGLLEGTGAELGLAHPLVASALYASLAPGERALWHANAARLLDAEADPETVALHLLHTDPAADPATVDALRAAAARSSARGAPESAAVFLDRALAEPPLDAAIAAAVRAELGLALAAHLQPEAPALLAEAVEHAASAGQRSDLALRGARALALGGHFERAIELCRRALDQPGDTDPDLLARLEAELVANAWTNAAFHDEAHERLRRPVLEPSPLELWRVSAAFQSMLAAEPAAETVEVLRPALEAGLPAGERDSLAAAGAMFVLIANDELDTARALCDAVIDTARPRGWLIALALGSHMRAWTLVRAGRVRDAEVDARLAFDYKLSRATVPAMLFVLHGLVDALTELDDLEAADAALAAVGQLGEPPPGGLAAPLVLQARARLRLAQRRTADAHADALVAAARWQELGTRHPGLATWRVDAAEALLDLGDARAARRLAEEHLALADRVGRPGPRGAGLRALAAAAPLGERIALLEQAAELLADSPAQLERSRALVDLGAALRRANRRADARGPLRQALDLAERGGMRRLARRARDELKAAGARPRRSALSGVDALTPAEHRVAALAADGYSNREIAQQLYVTQRTVETHLTHAFQKLDITTRTQLAARLNAPARGHQAPAHALKVA
jgi:DNA-binding CsgD family transcriptional regulator